MTIHKFIPGGPRRAMDSVVAKVSNLLYRRFPIGRTLACREPISVCRLEALRYSRLETGWKPALRATGGLWQPPCLVPEPALLTCGEFPFGSNGFGQKTLIGGS